MIYYCEFCTLALQFQESKYPRVLSLVIVTVRLPSDVSNQVKIYINKSKVSKVQYRSSQEVRVLLPLRSG